MQRTERPLVVNPLAKSGQLMADAAYRDALVHRYAGLERTILLQMPG